MSATPTRRANHLWQLENGDDFLQLFNSSNQIVSWIDSTGFLQGSGIGSGSLGLVTKYNGITTAGNGLVSEVAAVDLTNQSSPIVATTLYAPFPAGFFRVSAYLKITTVGTSPVIGPVTITYTDANSVGQSVVMATQTQAGAIATTNAGNTTTSVLTGSLVINCGLGNIQYAIGFSGTIGAGQYEAHLRLEKM
jgi:hypothetical protein